MSLSVLSWIDGITSTFVVMSGIIMGIFLFYKWRVSNIRMHFYTGLLLMFAGLSYAGVFLDFISVLLTGTNIINSYGQVAILSYIWIPPLFTLAIIVFVDILHPNKRLFFTVIYLILSIFFYVTIIIDPFGSFYFEDPPIPGVNLIKYNINLFSIAGAYIMINQFSILLFIFFGFVPKVIKAKILIRRKFLYIIVGMLTITISGGIEAWITPGIGIILNRGFYILGFYIWYLGLQPVKEYLSKEQMEEVTEEESDEIVLSIAEKLGIDIVKPDVITEEEIAFYKEQTLCLVCKKNLSHFTSLYICPECKSLYCQNCAQALTELENTCWFCSTPIDENKPIRRIIRKQEVVDLEKK